MIKFTPNLDWLILTKRIGNAAHMLPADWGEGYFNVWLGITVVTQAEADRDIPKLLNTPARVRWLSMEPLLEAVDLTNLSNADWPLDCLLGITQNTISDTYAIPSIDWVVVGGESGTCARPMDPEWARTVRDQCRIAGVSFLFKQWGEWGPGQTHNDGQIPQISIALDEGLIHQCQNGEVLYRLG